MTRLLHAQENLAKFNKDELYDFSVFLLERLLDIYQKELLPNEDLEVRNIAKDWGEAKKK